MFVRDARVIWNGNAVPTEPANMGAFLDKMPLSRHDVQTVDCHPLTCTLHLSSPAGIGNLGLLVFSPMAQELGRMDEMSGRLLGQLGKDRERTCSSSP